MESEELPRGMNSSSGALFTSLSRFMYEVLSSDDVSGFGQIMYHHDDFKPTTTWLRHEAAWRVTCAVMGFNKVWSWLLGIALRKEDSGVALACEVDSTHLLKKVLRPLVEESLTISFIHDYMHMFSICSNPCKVWLLSTIALELSHQHTLQQEVTYSCFIIHIHS